jgi:ABC-type nickel/cobalt efflux system permease component RcnA
MRRKENFPSQLLLDRPELNERSRFIAFLTGTTRRLFLTHSITIWVVAIFLVFFLPFSSFAHPMGNFSINHYSGLEIHPAFVRVLYVIDMAEIPTFQEMQDHSLRASLEEPELVTYRNQKIEELRRGLELRLGGKPLALVTKTQTLSFPPGAGGLPTMRLSAIYEAPLEALTGEMTYEDDNYVQRAGWKEITVTAQTGVTLRNSSVPSESKSQQLTNYAENLLQAPPQELRAALAFSMLSSARTPALASAATMSSSISERTGVQTPRNMLTELMTAGRLSTGVILFSLLVAVGLGAFHALEPGHGKTMVAAYLIGSRGTAWHALILGLTVTVSHTIGVYALGGVALFASQYIVPEQLYPWLGLASGLLIAGTGIFLLGQALQGQHGYHDHDHHSHDHGHDHDHKHAPRHTHDHEQARDQVHGHHHSHHTHGHDGSVSYGALLTLGVTGGLIPCPAALVVLLSAVALHRIAFGLLLIVAFSLGLAVVLVGTGLLLVSARGVVQRWSGEGKWLEYLPFMSPLVITPLGVVIAVRSLLGTGLLSGTGF